MSARTWLVYGMLVVLAAAFALMTRTSSDEGGDSSPTISNTRGGGLKALKLYLEATGVPTAAITDDLAKADWTTLVIAAPTARKLSLAEVSAVEQRIRAGATLIYFAPDERSQPELDGWLLISRGARLKPDPTSADPGGATAKVALQKGPFTGVRELRVSAGFAVESSDPGFLPVATAGEATVLLWKKHGDGQILVARGADLAENRRLELLDNLKLWDNLGALGPVAFDELHHQRPDAPPMSVGIIAFGVQALFAVLFLTFARGTRLGPPRPFVPVRHRAGIEYADSFAWLTRGAKAEAQLMRDVYERLRRLVHDKLGVPLTLPAAEFGREVERRLGIREGTWAELERQSSQPDPGPKDFYALSVRAAELEHKLRGSP